MSHRDLKYGHLTSFSISNFTTFGDVEFTWAAGINVLVGENATGKTHVLKALYALHKSVFENSSVADRLRGCFQVSNNSSLIRSGMMSSSLAASWGGERLGVTVAPNGNVGWSSSGNQVDVSKPVFIPAKDMLAHSAGFVSLVSSRNLSFDETYSDVILAAMAPALNEVARQSSEELLQLLALNIRGRVEVEADRFYHVSELGRLEMSLIAEGWRKLALLYQLIANGSLLPGTVLFWDEPETNLNPALMDEVVLVLLKLSRMGVQIFLATHSYIILREIEVQSSPTDEVRFFALDSTAEHGTKVNVAATYLDIRPNPIERQYASLYDRSIQKEIEAIDSAEDRGVSSGRAIEKD